MLSISSLVSYSFNENIDLVIKHFEDRAKLKNNMDFYKEITLLNLVFHYKLVNDTDKFILTN
jgi:hypothetical protein